ncbi:TRAP transporter permease [Thermodesulfobacteriota bacterium]
MAGKARRGLSLILDMSEEVKQTRYQLWVSRFTTVFGALAGLYFALSVSGIFEAFDIFVPPGAQRASYVLVLLILIFLLPEGRARAKLPWYDALLIIISLVSTGYQVLFVSRIREITAGGCAELPEIIFSFLLAAVVIEATRRRLGLVVALLAMFFLVQPLISNHLPGILHGRGYSAGRMAYELYLSRSGLIGFVTEIGATLVFIFVMFGQFLQVCGAGNWFIRLALAVAGHLTGGPGKSAVVASALFGTISGASAANVAITGSVTIPTMKRYGYSPAFAGGVEAAASTGGVFMPPVMGAVAFIIAEWLGIRYWAVCLAAFLPALLYFMSIFIMVHQEARRQRLPRIARSELPRIGSVIKEGWYWLLPVALILVLLAVFGFSPEQAGFWGLIFVVMLSMIKRETRMTPRKVINTLRDGMITNLLPGIACTMVGIMTASLYLTGIGLRLSGHMVSWAGGNLPLLLVLTAVTSLILGMGLPSIAAYTMVVALVAPALTELGIAPLAAHLFVFYYAMLCHITPPFATAAYTAGGIANANPISCAFHAVRLALVAYIVPFAFVFTPSLMLQGGLAEIAFTLAAAGISIVALGCGAVGYLIEKTNWFVRIALISGGGLLLAPATVTRLTGLLIVALAFIPDILFWQKNTHRLQGATRE